MRKIYLGAIIITLVAALILGGCGEPTTTATTTTTASSTQTTPPTSSTTTTAATTTAATTTTVTPKSGGIVRFAKTADITTPIGYPLEYKGSVSGYVLPAAERMFLELADGSLESKIIESYEVSADPPYIILHIKEGVTFSDGTPCNAEAVRWNLQGIQEAATAKAHTKTWDYFEILGEYDLKLNFLSWANTNLRGLGTGVSVLVSPTAFEENGAEWMRWNIVGIGAFLQDVYQLDVEFSFVKNPNYWMNDVEGTDLPYLDGFEWVFVADETSALALFESGGVEVMTSNNRLVLQTLADEGNQIVSYVPGNWSLYPDSANADSPWSILEVRQAAEYAIDKEAIASTFGYNCEPAYQLLPSTSKAYDPTITGRTYDLDKAKQLMEDAGYADGFDTVIIPNPSNVNKDTLIAIQHDLAQIGIQAEIQYVSSASYREMTDLPVPTNTVIYDTFPNKANPNVSFNELDEDRRGNQSIAVPEGYQEALDASLATAALDPELLWVMENMLYDNATFIPIYFTTSNTIIKPYVMDHGLGTKGDAVTGTWDVAWLNN